MNCSKSSPKLQYYGPNTALKWHLCSCIMICVKPYLIHLKYFISYSSVDDSSAQELFTKVQNAFDSSNCHFLQVSISGWWSCKHFKAPFLVQGELKVPFWWEWWRARRPRQLAWVYSQVDPFSHSCSMFSILLPGYSLFMIQLSKYDIPLNCM